MKIMKLLSAFSAALFLAACYDSGDTSTDAGWGDDSGGGSSVTLRPRAYTCPANCENVQTRTSCQAAESYYEVYSENAKAGASGSVLDQLYNNHASAARLAGEMVRQISCTP